MRVAAPLLFTRHPELVSGSISQLGLEPREDEWMLKQVQNDGCFYDLRDPQTNA